MGPGPDEGWAGEDTLRRAVTVGRAFTITVVVATAQFVAGAIVTYVQRGWTWVSVGLAASIERIEEAKGGPAALRLTDGTWVKLPPVGPYIGNSVRAWLRR